MKPLQFRQYSVAHQLGLLNELEISEVINLRKYSNLIQVEYIDNQYEINKFSVDQVKFVDALEKRIQSVYISCEFKYCQGINQFLLVSKELGKSLGLDVIKERTIVSMCNLDLSYQRALVLANSVQYKPPIEKKALCQDWLVYERLRTIAHWRCQVFHKEYSSTFNRRRDTIANLEKTVMSAYENFDSLRLDQALERIENVKAVLPLAFVERSRRLYLEIVKIWLMVDYCTDRLIERTREYINFFQLSPVYLSSDANWANIRSALNYF